MRSNVNARGIAAALVCLVLFAGTAWADPPKVTMCKPANGATEVPRDVGVLLVYFDRNMKVTQWTLWPSDQGEFPPIAAPDENPWRDPRTLELKLEVLKPGTTYAIQLSSAKAKKQGFRSAEGDEPLPDTVITFTTNTVGLAPDSAPPGPVPAPKPAPEKPRASAGAAHWPPIAADLIGTWRQIDDFGDVTTFAFRRDGTFTFSFHCRLIQHESTGPYEVKGEVVILHPNDLKDAIELEFGLDGAQLYLFASEGHLFMLDPVGVAPDPTPGPAPVPGPTPVPKPSPFGPRPAGSPLVGTWIDGTGAMTVALKADGSFTRTMRTKAGEDQATGTWLAKDGVLEIRTDGEDETHRIRYAMPDKDTITLTGDEGSSDRLRRVGAVGPGPGPSPLPPASPLVGVWFAEDPTGSTRVDLRADGTHASVFTNPQGRRETTGTWAAEGGTLTIRLVELSQVLSWPFTQPDRDTILVTLPGGIWVALKRQ